LTAINNFDFHWEGAMKTACLLLALLLPLLVGAQPGPPEEMWRTELGTANGGDAANDVREIPAGGFIVAAHVQNYGASLLWLTDSGTVARTHGYDSLGVHAVYAVLPVEGGFIWAGQSRDYRAIFARTDSVGDTLWVRKLTFTSGSSALCRTDDGNFVGVVATAEGSGLIKFSPTGDTLWMRTTRNYVQQTRSVHELAGGGVVAAGLPFWPGHTGRGEFLLTRFAGNGDTVWHQEYPCDSINLTDVTVEVAADSGFYLSGGGTDLLTYLRGWLVRTNSAGDTLWTRHGGPRNAGSPLALADGGCLVTGDGITLKRFDANGDSVWERSYDAPQQFETDIPVAVRQVSDGGFVVATQGANSIPESVPAVVRFSAELDAPESPLRGLPVCTQLLDNYPNPFNPTTEIRFELAKAGMVSLVVYDLTGREIGTLVAGFKEAGRHSVTFDGSGIASGVYFCRLQADDMAHTKKLVLLK
jgi:hypothetical protein